MKKAAKLLFLIWLLVNIYTAFVIVRYPEVSASQVADVAMVLGSPVQENMPSEVFSARLNHGIELYKSRKVFKILITGGKGSKNRLSEAEAGKNYAIKTGVPAEDILTETHSISTFENFTFSKSILKENNLETVLVVSDPYHMSRAMKMANDNSYKAYASPTPFTRFKSTDSKIFFVLMEIPKFQSYVIGRLF